jgi:four helix bundle protein
MPSFKTFKDIAAWQQARELTRDIYAASNGGAFSKDFGLRDQIRRASISIMANIAEGHERSGTSEFVQFLSISKGSAGEVEATSTWPLILAISTERRSSGCHQLLLKRHA